MQNEKINQQSIDHEFISYLKQEHSYIAEAHFKTIETISSFFKNYIALMTIPIVLIAYLFSRENISFLNFIPSLQLYGGTLLLVISIAGATVMIYIINLRLDAILYARTVNGIRKYFYDRAKVDINTKLRMRILPQSPVVPAYHEVRYFLPVIVTFSLLNSFYYTLGYIAIMKYSECFFLSLTFASGILFLSLHFLL